MKAIVPIRGSGLSVRRLLVAVPCASLRCFSLLLVHDQRLGRSKLRSSKAERCCIVPTLSPADGSADSVIRLLSHVCGCSPSLSLNPPRPNGKKVCAPPHWLLGRSKSADTAQNLFSHPSQRRHTHFQLCHQVTSCTSRCELGQLFDPGTLQVRILCSVHLPSLRRSPCKLVASLGDASSSALERCSVSQTV